MTRPFEGNRNAPIGSVGAYTSPTTFVDVATGRPTTPDQVRWIFTNRFAAQIFGSPFGVGRNTLRGPNFGRANLDLYKNLKFNERFKAQIRWEAENVFNTPFLGIPDFEVDDAPFGTYLNPAASAFNVFPRRMIFGVRLLF